MKTQNQLSAFVKKQALKIAAQLIFLQVIFAGNLNASSYYWVGGTGNWSDYGNHWATTSGGLIFHTQTPTPLDDVFFDGNSFQGTVDTMIIDIPMPFCHDINWSGITDTVFVLMLPNVNINIYGSLIWNPLAFPVYPGNYYKASFNSDSTGNTILAANSLFYEMYFNGAGEWTLLDELYTGGLFFNNGTFNTNNYDITAGPFYVPSAIPKTINLGTSVINGSYWSIQNGSFLNLDADSASINILNTGGSINQFGNNFNYHHVLFTPNYQQTIGISGDNNFDKLVFLGNGNVYIKGSNIIDTLLVNNLGYSISFDAGTTQTINNTLMTNANASQSISFKSGTLTSPAYMNSASGSICLNYVTIKDIHASGVTFFAGVNSINLGNNTGWSFTSCSPVTTNVWPGDANYDLTANNFDILNIGVAFGNTGTTRAGANNSWTAQPSLTWQTQFIRGVNLNNADCDGNGLVDASDTLAVALNYGQTHPPRLSSPQNSSWGMYLYFTVPTGVNSPNTQIAIPINLGTQFPPADSIYGIAFTINYDASLVQSGSMYIDYSSSFIATSGNWIHLEKDFPTVGKLDMALCRTNHQNVLGYGAFATLYFTVAATASGPLALSFSDIKAISANEIEIPVVAQGGNVFTGINEFNNNNLISLYPNPVNEYLFIDSKNNSLSRIEVYDNIGKKVLESPLTENRIYVGNLSKGIYCIKFYNEKSLSAVRKVVKE